MLAALPLMVPQVGADVLVQPTASTAREMKSAPLFSGTLAKSARKAGAHRAIASRDDSGLDITVKGFGETTALWSEDFNGGSLPQGWQIDLSPHLCIEQRGFYEVSVGNGTAYVQVACGIVGVGIIGYMPFGF